MSDRFYLGDGDRVEGVSTLLPVAQSGELDAEPPGEHDPGDAELLARHPQVTSVAGTRQPFRRLCRVVRIGVRVGTDLFMRHRVHAGEGFIRHA